MPTVEQLNHSYGVEPDFYTLWLDPYRAYSCANWEGTDSLEDAQVGKLDRVLHGLDLPAGGTLLDVGCGWGSLLQRAGEAGYKATGITPARSQVDWCNEHDLQARLASWQDHQPDEPVDGIASIGSFEHFAGRKDKKEDRERKYAAFFEWCHRHLRPGGRLYLQTICMLRIDLISTREALRVQRTVLKEFPGSALPRELSEIIDPASPWFEVTNIRARRADYGKTCRTWLRRLTAKRAEAVAIVGEEKVAHFEAYLDAAATNFEQYWTTLYQIFFQRWP